MHLSIYSIEKTIFDGEVASVTLPTPLGEMTVLEHHIPLVSTISAGEIRYVLTGNTVETVAFRGGILEVQPESRVVVLANV